MAERVPLLDQHGWQRQPFGQWVAHNDVLAGQRSIALWLQKGGFLWLSSRQNKSGKSHLLQHLKEDISDLGIVCPARLKGDNAERVRQCLEQLAAYSHWAIDMDHGACDDATGFCVFHLIERARQASRPLLISWSCDNEQLSPPELSSRLRSFEKVYLAPPQDDDALIAVLHSVAHNLHWELPPSVLQVMLTHTARSFSHQLDVLLRLERESRPERVRPTQRWTKQKLARIDPPTDE